MRIEVLYVPGCPNYQPTLKRVQSVLESESVSDEIQRTPVTSDAEAKVFLFPGSPTVRVNGEDVSPNETHVPGLACRLYPDGTGVPSESLLRTAVSRAKQNG